MKKMIEPQIESPTESPTEPQTERLMRKLLKSWIKTPCVLCAVALAAAAALAPAQAQAKSLDAATRTSASGRNFPIVKLATDAGGRDVASLVVRVPKQKMTKRKL